MRGVLVLDGDPPGATALALLDAADLVVAADGGANVLVDAGRPPDVLVGDLDNIRPDVLETVRARGAVVEQHPAAKAAIDGFLAFDHLMLRNPDSVLVLGALGGRLAMTISHLELLRRCLARGVAARMVGSGQSLSMAAEGQHVQVAGHAGMVFNVLADSAGARINIRGSAYDVDGLEIAIGDSVGLSNEVGPQGSAIVDVCAGRVLVVEETG